MFLKKIKHEADLVKQNESNALSLQNASEMELNEIKIKALKKQHNLDVARINQALWLFFQLIYDNNTCFRNLLK